VEWTVSNDDAGVRLDKFLAAPQRLRSRGADAEGNTFARSESHRSDLGDIHRWTGARLQIGAGDAERNAVAVRDREGKAQRHHADDGVHHIVEADRALQDLGVARELALPFLEAMTTTGGTPGRSSCSISVRPSAGVTPVKLKPDAVMAATRTSCARPSSAIRLRLSSRKGADGLDGFQLAAPLNEVLRRGAEGVSGIGTGHRPVADDNGPLAFFNRQRGVEHGAEDGEVSGADGDRQCHADDGDERQDGILDEHADAELYVDPRYAHTTPFLSGNYLRKNRR
jgi:hypothetical protein